MKRWLVAAVSMTVCLSAALRAEEACKTLQLKNPAPTLSEIYAMAEKAAKAWKADAVPAQISTTSLGPLQPNGSAASWNIQFYSKASDSHVAISVFRGSMTCWADKGPAPFCVRRQGCRGGCDTLSKRRSRKCHGRPHQTQAQDQLQRLDQVA